MNLSMNDEGQLVIDPGKKTGINLEWVCHEGKSALILWIKDGSFSANIAYEPDSSTLFHIGAIVQVFNERLKPLIEDLYKKRDEFRLN